MYLPTPSPITMLIDEHYARQPQRFSSRLGASQIGEPCDRSLWYSFRHASEPVRSGQLNRICETGHWYEARIIGWLRAIGIQVEAPEQQYEFTACSGHFVCKLDGAVLGVPEAPKTWHVLECKHANRDKFVRVARGIEKNAPKWYCQAQVAMLLSGMDRCLFVVADKNETWRTEDVYTERVRLDRAAAQALIDKAQAVIDATELPPRIADTPEARDCMFCDHRPVCHSGVLPRKSCRTCAFSDAADGGRWLCAVAASMRGLANNRPPADFKEDVVACPEALCCPNHLYLEALDGGESLRKWMEGWKQ